jgi:hypothetical protein
MRAGEHRRGLRRFILVITHPELTRVGTGHDEARIEIRMQRIVGQGSDVLEFLVRIQWGFVDQADLPAGVPT